MARTRPRGTEYPTPRKASVMGTKGSAAAAVPSGSSAAVPPRSSSSAAATSEPAVLPLFVAGLSAPLPTVAELSEPRLHLSRDGSEAAGGAPAPAPAWPPPLITRRRCSAASEVNTASRSAARGGRRAQRGESRAVGERAAACRRRLPSARRGDCQSRGPAPAWRPPLARSQQLSRQPRAGARPAGRNVQEPTPELGQAGDAGAEVQGCAAQARSKNGDPNKGVGAGEAAAPGRARQASGRVVGATRRGGRAPSRRRLLGSSTDATRRRQAPRAAPGAPNGQRGLSHTIPRRQRLGPVGRSELVDHQPAQAAAVSSGRGVHHNPSDGSSAAAGCITIHQMDRAAATGCITIHQMDRALQRAAGGRAGAARPVGAPRRCPPIC